MNTRVDLLAVMADTIKAYADLTGSFTRKQAYAMRPDQEPYVVDRALWKAMQRRIILPAAEEKNFNYPDVQHFRAHEMRPFDPDKANMLWPLLVKKGDIVYGKNTKNKTDIWMTHGTYPSEVTFLLDGVLYDTIPLNEANKSLLIQVDREYQRNKEAGTGDQYCIFMIDNEDFIDTLPLIDVPHEFCIVNPPEFENPITTITE